MTNMVAALGVNTHIDFVWSAYKNRKVVIDSINWLGIKHLRDSANNAGNVKAGWWKEVAEATGCKFTAFVGSTGPEGMVASLDNALALAPLGIIEALEGGNEEDGPYAIGLGNDLSKTAEFQKRVYAVGTKLKLPVINMSFGHGWDKDPQHGDYDNVGDLSAYADFANAHVYPVPGQASDYAFNFINGLAQLAAKGRPIVATEFGFHTTPKNASGQTEQQQADRMKAGIARGTESDVRVFLYELLDQETGNPDPEKNFGLFKSDGTPKQAAYMVRDLLLLGAGTPASTKPTPSITKTATGYAITDAWARDHAGKLALNLQMSGSLNEINTALAPIPAGLFNQIQVFNQAGNQALVKITK